ncbi:MAG: aminotransferase class I/II-fold pyridoxal phosphate-dependent enzyme, partial [Bacteroidota bacterium]
SHALPKVRGVGCERFAQFSRLFQTIMLYDAVLAQRMADALLDEGIYVIGFSYPVVPKGEARIRVQISAGHTRAHLDRAMDAFERVGKDLGVLEG